MKNFSPRSTPVKIILLISSGFFKVVVREILIFRSSLAARCALSAKIPSPQIDYSSAGKAVFLGNLTHFCLACEIPAETPE
jgi:hypothetical protein